MKLSRFAMLLFCAAFFLISCGSNESTEKAKTETTMKNDAGIVKEPAMEKNTIVTTPQNMVTILHKVADFTKWQPAYDAHDSARLANGLHSYVIGRGYNDPSMVLVAMRPDDMSKAKMFVKDPNMKKVMNKAGVIGAPSMSFLTSVWQDTATLAPDVLRSRTTFMVKDWDVWYKAFQEGKQERMDNGILDRVISHDVDDNKKVQIVTAVIDTTKAFAYYKSDALKKRREASGVIGEPQRFLFQVVKRY
jgi:ABC-type Fe3+-hydroxamate transport system substrate-binding protein